MRRQRKHSVNGTSTKRRQGKRQRKRSVNGTSTRLASKESRRDAASIRGARASIRDAGAPIHRSIRRRKSSGRRRGRGDCNYGCLNNFVEGSIDLGAPPLLLLSPIVRRRRRRRFLWSPQRQSGHPWIQGFLDSRCGNRPHCSFRVAIATWTEITHDMQFYHDMQFMNFDEGWTPMFLTICLFMGTYQFYKSCKI